MNTKIATLFDNFAPTPPLRLLNDVSWSSDQGFGPQNNKLINAVISILMILKNYIWIFSTTQTQSPLSAAITLKTEHVLLKMKKSDDMPLWVFLAFSSVERRKTAMLLIWSFFVFSIYSLPWSLYFTDQTWVSTLFLIDDWSWFGMMVPMTAWYWISLRWIDNNGEWEDSAKNWPRWLDISLLKRFDP